MQNTILIVDDEEHMLRLLQFALRAVDARIETCRSGEEALGFLAEQSVQLVLLDYSMPGMDGVETLRKIRELGGGSELKVLMLTARDQTAIRADAAGLNVQAFLTKPFSPSDLSARVREILRPSSTPDSGR